MKNFLIAMFIILICAGFFAGWTQFAVPHGSYGVMRSKSHGLENQVIEPGAVRWVWYKLIPSNVKISVFKLTPRTVFTQVENVLPQAGAYTSFAGSVSDFTFNLEAALTYSINTKALPELVSENNIFKQEELDAFLSGLDEKVSLEMKNFLISMAEDKETLEKINEPEIENKLKDVLEKEFPYLEPDGFSPTALQEPNFELYYFAQNLYNAYIERQTEILKNEALNQAQSQVASQFRLDELEKYGELLTKYPILIEYLKLKE
ncbi:MAG: hypothetical protein LBC53_02985 [Spirochaetaceae bacterium]|jgi:hypothetical protein|nr:hypothetical protein [Spirochaetaceae bacterium]